MQCRHFLCGKEEETSRICFLFDQQLQIWRGRSRHPGQHRKLGFVPARSFLIVSSSSLRHCWACPVKILEGRHGTGATAPSVCWSSRELGVPGQGVGGPGSCVYLLGDALHPYPRGQRAELGSWIVIPVQRVFLFVSEPESCLEQITPNLFCNGCKGGAGWWSNWLCHSSHVYAQSLGVRASALTNQVRQRQHRSQKQ